MPAELFRGYLRRAVPLLDGIRRERERARERRREVKPRRAIAFGGAVR